MIQNAVNAAGAVADARNIFDKKCNDLRSLDRHGWDLQNFYYEYTTSVKSIPNVFSHDHLIYRT